MRNKILVIGVAMLMVVSMLLVGCAPAAAPVVEEEEEEATMLPVEVTCPVIENCFWGSEGIVLLPNLNIFNPNPYPVVLRDVPYTVETVGVVLQSGSGRVLNIMIPAESQSTVVPGFVTLIPFPTAGVFTAGGFTLQDAMAGPVLALWKSLGGALYSSAYAEAWDALEPEDLTFVVSGRIEQVSPEGQELVVDYSDSWLRIAVMN